MVTIFWAFVCKNVFLFTDMLTDQDARIQGCAVRCLDLMSTSNAKHWRPILEAGLSRNFHVFIAQN